MEDGVDLAKVTQMLDTGWRVAIVKHDLGGYCVRALHPSPARMEGARSALIADLQKRPDWLKTLDMTAEQAVDEFDMDDGYIITDDFTPEKALTRMAYKIFGEIL